MKLLLILLLVGCKSTLELTITNCYSGRVYDTTIRAKDRICIVTFEGDTIQKLVDKHDKVLLDSVCDFKVKQIKK